MRRELIIWAAAVGLALWSAFLLLGDFQDAGRGAAGGQWGVLGFPALAALMGFGFAQASARLFLTPRPDEDFPEDAPLPTVPEDIDLWLNRLQVLEARPLIFINGCEGAKMDSFFYKGFATTFLQHHAGAVVGPETEIPVLFARDFAVDFFKEFFRGGPQNSIGRVLIRVRREYMSKWRNPLGLVYSLYRGGDLYIDGPVPQTAPAPTPRAGPPADPSQPRALAHD